MIRFLATILLFGCSLAAYADAILPAEKVRARKLYVVKCAKCHKFYEPRLYRDAEWEGWMDSMSQKSKLKPADEALLRRYLSAYRAGEIPSPK